MKNTLIEPLVAAGPSHAQPGASLHVSSERAPELTGWDACLPELCTDLNPKP